MNGTEIIQIIMNAASAVLNSEPAGAIVSAIVTAIFLRGNTKTEAFEKLKTGKLDLVIEELLQNGIITYSEVYKAKNASKIAKKADRYFAEKKYSVQNVTYDFDWFMRFYEAVGNISEEAMQDIWARILAGEINKPSSYSLRTLEILKNMSKKEAETFQEICRYAVGEGTSMCLPNYMEYTEASGIEYDEILLLAELGLVHDECVVSVQTSASKDKGICVYNDKYVVSLVSKRMNTTAFEYYPFTRAGCELASIQDNIMTDHAVMTLADILRNTRKDLNISVHFRVKTGDGNLKFKKTEVPEQIIRAELLSNGVSVSEGLANIP